MNTELVGTSKHAEQMRNFAHKVSTSDYPILLQGPTGVGKDLLAELIHTEGRKQNPFVSFNCGGLPDTLLESELFGHVRGAFTDARTDRKGLIEHASGGTLFFNEIGNMSFAMQARLLAIMENKSFRKLGSNINIKVQTRIITATNLDLEDAISQKGFRLDLYHRMNVLSFDIRPLRERREDIPTLAQHFLNRESKGNQRFFDTKAIDMMSEYPWPGNIRQLENTVKAIALFSSSEKIGVNDLCRHLTISEEKLVLNPFYDVSEGRFKTYEEVQLQYIIEVLKSCNGNVSMTTRATGLSRCTVYRILNQGGLVVDQLKKYKNKNRTIPN